MSQVVLNSNQSSNLFSTLAQQKVTDFFSYSLPANSPNQTNVEHTKVSPRSLPSAANIPGSEIEFVLPQTGLLENACLYVSVKGAPDTNTAINQLGLRLFETITLRSQNKTIHSYSSHYNHARYQALDINKSSGMISLVEGSGTVNSDNSIIFVIPIWSSFFENSSMYLPVAFLQQMSITAKFNSLVNMGLAGQAFTDVDVYLWTKTVQMSSPVYQAYLANQFLGPTLNVLITDTYSETDVTIAAADTSVVATLKCPYNIKRTFFSIHNTGTEDVGPTTSGYISTVDFRLNGSLAFDDVPMEVIKMFSLKDHPSNLQSVAFGDSYALSVKGTADNSGNVYSINYGQSDDTTYNSGCISMQSIQNPTMTFGLGAAIGSTGFVIKITHEVLRLVTMDKSSGRIDSSYAS